MPLFTNNNWAIRYSLLTIHYYLLVVVDPPARRHLVVEVPRVKVVRHLHVVPDHPEHAGELAVELWRRAAAVLAADGGLTGYAGGLENKKKLLRLEGQSV